MYKRKCKVFIISTSATVTRILYVKNTNILENNPFLKTNPSDKYQHLYITSDEEIKEDDWFITNQNGHWELQKCQKICDDGIIMSFEEEIAMDQENTYFVFKSKSCKKIIATTDTSLRLPQPPQEFIEAYIKAYNEGNPITEVMVEYEIICGRCYSNTDECWSAKECSRNTDFPDIVKLKVNSDNTINIKLIKDKWSREEVEQLCKLAFKYHCDNSRTTSLPDKWIEENL